MKSRRSDKRGHWPKGKRRNPGSKDAARMVRQAHRDGFSWGLIASAIGVDERQVRRYAAGEDWPSAVVARRITKYFRAE